MKFQTNWLAACTAAFAFANCIHALAQPQLVIHSSSQPPNSVLLSVWPGTSNWVLLEASQDLVTWDPVVNLLITNSAGPYVDFPPSNAVFRFYRVRSPGVTVTEAASAWDAQKPGCYQYRFENTKLEDGGVVLVGTVTISNGVKTVTDATANGFPTTSFDPADFLTPEEVFGVIADVQAHGAKLAHVSYDEHWSFPAAVTIIRSTTSPPIYYRLSDFVMSAGDREEPGWQRE